METTKPNKAEPLTYEEQMGPAGKKAADEILTLQGLSRLLEAEKEFQRIYANEQTERAEEAEADIKAACEIAMKDFLVGEEEITTAEGAAYSLNEQVNLIAKQRDRMEDKLAEVVDAAKEAADLLDDPDYTPDSFSSQPLRKALSNLPDDGKVLVDKEDARLLEEDNVQMETLRCELYYAKKKGGALTAERDRLLEALENRHGFRCPRMGAKPDERDNYACTCGIRGLIEAALDDSQREGG